MVDNTRKGAGMSPYSALQWIGDASALEAPPEAEPLTNSSFNPFAHHRISLAMKSLPRNWQTLLWYIDVLGHTPAEAATILGMTDSTITEALLQAREGLRRAYRR